MSVANANAFALLDDEGTIDAGELVAKIPVRQNEVPKKDTGDSKQGEYRREPHICLLLNLSSSG